MFENIIAIIQIVSLILAEASLIQFETIRKAVTYTSNTDSILFVSTTTKKLVKQVVLRAFLYLGRISCSGFYEGIISLI
jgi:hypothetical protein